MFAWRFFTGAPPCQRKPALAGSSSGGQSLVFCYERRRGDGGRPQNQEVTGLLPVPPTVWAQVDFVDVAKQQSPAGIVFERVSLKR